jgi:hypothetical protein
MVLSIILNATALIQLWLLNLQTQCLQLNPIKDQDIVLVYVGQRNCFSRTSLNFFLEAVVMQSASH